MAQKTKRGPSFKHIFRHERLQKTINYAAKEANVDKLTRDVIKYVRGIKFNEGDPKLGFTETDPDVPIATSGEPWGPSEQHPICQACGMFTHNCNNPFLPYHGSPQPLVTFVFDSVNAKEDTEGWMSANGSPAAILRKFVDAFASETGVTSDDCRFVALTRCAHRMKQPITLKGKCDKCKVWVVEDLIKHPPVMIIPVGSIALGALCHKSNAQEWGGRLLTYRGWPDDWLTNSDYVKPRLVPMEDEFLERTGHELFGPPPGPESWRLLYPLQVPRLVFMQQNQLVEDEWKRQIIRGLRLAREGVTPPNYNLPWYCLLTDKDQVIEALRYIIDHPGMVVCYDTETSGLAPFQGDRIVFQMFRYTNPETGDPVAFGFPWNYAHDPERNAGPSPLLPYLDEIRPYIEQAITVSAVVGHHVSFDTLFNFCDLTGHENMNATDESGVIREDWRVAMRRLNALADAAKFDTWHMAYCRRQERGSLGLEVLAYDHVPELAGYEEAFTLLIELEKKKLHPEEGGHYANCPPERWEDCFKPYVMGDVEVCYRARDALQEKLDRAKVRDIPIAHQTKRGFFRYASTPSRSWLYERIMSPAARVLMKMMGRGMFIDEKVLTKLENQMPAGISSQIREMREIAGTDVESWCKKERRKDPYWELDLEKKDHLRELLFNQMKLPIQRLTKTGRKIYGEDAEQWDERIRASLVQQNPERQGADLDQDVRAEMLKYAALDKFTLNKLAVDHTQVRPLQDYRKLHKLYTTYVRPLRNYKSDIVDKKDREKRQHLCSAWLIHAWFMLTGTRGGRLSCRDPNLQQLPKKAFEQFNVKEMYVSRFGDLGCLYGADFSQIELRLLAAMSGDKSMVNAYLNDIDLHTLTASRLFKVPYETFSKEHMRKLEETSPAEAKALRLKRDIAKTCNFLTGYGGGAFGLQTVLANNQIYWQLEDCEKLIRLFFESYPAVRDLLSYYKAFIQTSNVAVSMFGRVRVFEEAQSGDPEISSKALRAGCNHLIQSTASDMMLICLVIIEDLMRQEGLESILVSTVHDSLVIDTLRSELPQVHQIVDTVLNNMPEFFKAYLGEDYDTSWMIVPFAGDSDVGLNYADMRGVPKEERIDWDKLLA